MIENDEVAAITAAVGEPPAFSAQSVAAYLGVSVDWLTREACKGTIPSVKAHQRAKRTFRAEHIKAIVEMRTVEAARKADPAGLTRRARIALDRTHRKAG